MLPICRDPNPVERACARAQLAAGKAGRRGGRICLSSLSLSVARTLTSISPTLLVPTRADRATLARGSRSSVRASLARFTFVSFHCHALDACVIEARPRGLAAEGKARSLCVRFAFLRRPVASERAAAGRQAGIVSRPFFLPFPPRFCFVDGVARVAEQTGH